ncbi:MAG TPA: hypothetical protein VGZ52_01285 [Acidimicrobiales bacterium]|nr:hypothetical protein [Acidimicrobiales bacterium]
MTARVDAIVDVRDFARASSLLAAIWGYPAGHAPMTPEALRALIHSGNYVAGAWMNGELVAASAGWLGLHGDDAFLHSHITGVEPAYQGGEIGLALKRHQRTWALERGLTAIEWTFDPLVRRNAYFNLAKLRAVVVGYEVDFYGAMSDSTNAGEETDRAVTRWCLDASPPPRVDADGAAIVLAANDDGRPRVEQSDADVLRAWIPEDYLRDRNELTGWRRAVRDTVGVAIRAGYVATEMSRDGWYTLVRGPV